MPRVPLTRDKILQTALKIINEQGLDGLSMRKLAAKLNVEAMSLYNHVKDKEDLLNGLTNLVLSSIALPDEQLSWQKTLEYFAVSLYQAFLKHPPLVTVIESYAPGDLHVLQGMERVLLALEKSGLKPREQISAFRGLVAMCLGFVLAHTGGLTSSKQEAEAEWGQWTGEHWDKAKFPQLVRFAPYFQETHPDEDFKFMLQAYLEFIKRKGK